MLKFILTCTSVILFTAVEDSSCGKGGNYPISVYESYYGCKLKLDDGYCKNICGLHGVSYGYCYASYCWCEKLSDRNVRYWDYHRNNCKNDLLYP
uniref:Neurotoxin 213 n=1 Tax=Lychas mucronatus TaxID=172552 RepID=STX13_LYCMC|nr:RecName: Full=Neurotoxin 213; Flags: Precursor [Lychas mucronatus]